MRRSTRSAASSPSAGVARARGPARARRSRLALDRDLVARARQAAAPRAESLAADRRRLGDVLVRAAAGSLVELHVLPPAVVRRPGDRPLASPLARRQAGHGDSVVTTLRHTSVRIEDPLAAFLLTRLDGTRERPQLLADVRAFVAGGGLDAFPDVTAPGDHERPAALEQALERLAELGLLSG